MIVSVSVVVKNNTEYWVTLLNPYRCDAVTFKKTCLKEQHLNTWC